MTSQGCVLGMYGKIPIMGDFVSRRLPGDFVQSWDAWLQDAVSDSKQKLGPGWLDIYLTSPIWRFILSSGVCGTKAWAGVLIPSVDRVGRYFPLTLAAKIPEKSAVPRWFIQAGEWFEDVENLALSGLQDDFNIAEFEEHQGISLPVEGWYTESNHNLQDGFYIEMATGDGMPDALADLSSGLMNRFMSKYSLWSSIGSEYVRPCLRVYKSLPPASAYSTFLTDGANSKKGKRIEPN